MLSSLRCFAPCLLALAAGCSSSSYADDQDGTAGSGQAGTSQAGTGNAGSAGTSSGGSSGTNQGGSAGTAGTLEEVCAQFAKVFCAKFITCRPRFAELAFEDPARCESQLYDGCLRQSAAPGSNPLPAGCLRAIEDAECPALTDSSLDAACQIPGSHRNGDPCVYNTQCASGYCSGNGASCGTCETPPGENGDCHEVGCKAGRVCNASFLCVEPAAVGEPCDEQTPCEPLHSCRGGFCKAPLPLGSPCGIEQGMCNLTEIELCLPSSMGGDTCQRATIGVAGDSCADVSVMCSSLTWCDSTTRTCTARSAVGERCENTLECTPGAICQGGSCAMPNAEDCQG